MKYLRFLIFLPLSYCYSQQITLEGHAIDSTRGWHVIEITVNDTLSKLMANPKNGRAKYLRIYQNPKYVVRTDSTGRFKIKAKLTDSLFFKSYQHHTETYSVKDLIQQKPIKITLKPLKQ